MRRLCSGMVLIACAGWLASPTVAQETQAGKPDEFAPVQEVQSAFFDRQDVSAFIDLDTGKPVDQAPASVIPKTEELRKSGADMYSSGMLSSSNMRVAFELVAVPVAPEEWDKATAAAIVKQVAWAVPKSGQILGAGHQTTYFFKTNQGTMGVLQMAASADGQKLPIHIKRITAETAKELLAKYPSQDYSSPGALIRTYLHSLDINDRDAARACIWADKGEEKWAAAQGQSQSASLRLVRMAAARLGADGAKAFEPLVSAPDMEGLMQVKWVVEGDRAHAEKESPAAKDMELRKIGERWQIHYTPPTAAQVAQETSRLEVLAKAADATADRMAFENPYATSAQAVTAFQSNLANAMAMAQRLGREGGR